MTWTDIGAIVALMGFIGLILIAAAKSIFRTKAEAEKSAKAFTAKLYDEKGLTHFMPRSECDKHKEESERRRDDAQRKTCELLKEIKGEFKINYKEIVLTQTALSREVSVISGQFKQFLDEDINNSKVDKLSEHITDLIKTLKDK